MRYIKYVVAVCLLGFVISHPLLAGQSSDVESPVLRDPELLELSRQYSNTLTEQNPLLATLLEKLGYDYLHQLDASKVYSINETTHEVTIYTQEEINAQVTAAGISFGFGSTVAVIRAGAADIIGQGKTVITCPLGAQTANVNGFMASTRSRDPIAGIRDGVLVVDNVLTSVSEVNFRVLKLTGGAKNPANRTAMETTHTGSCGGDLRVANLVSTWPPLRVDMAIDDTGSMGNELGGVKSALTRFISTHNTDADKVQRDVSYELITFKDSPTLRLANTQDSAAAISAVNALYPSGGGDCPEDAVGALNLALDNLTGDEDSEGQILLVTDASPRGGSISGVISRAQSLGVKVNVLLSGDCVATTAGIGLLKDAADTTPLAIVSAREVFSKLAKETGGLYYYMPSGSSADYAEVIFEMFETAVAGDSEPPVVSVSATPTILWPPNHKMIRIAVDVVATDDIDPDPLVALVGVESSEPADGQGDGNTADDIRIDADGAIYLRAERSGSGDGRFYTITYKATDASGNVGFGSIDILVPHNL